jgi:hypothetical protein
VVEINGFLNPNAPTFFPRFPFRGEIPGGGQNARVSWRQLLRTKRNNGKLIEDAGIQAEPKNVFKPVLTDIQPTGSSVTQYDRIAQDLNRIAAETRKKDLYFATIPPVSTFEEQIGQPVSFVVDVQGMSRVIVSDEQGVTKRELNVRKDKLSTRQQLQVRFDSGITKPQIVRYNIKAFDSRGQEQMNTFRLYRFKPTQFSFLQVNVGSNAAIPFGNASYGVQYDEKRILDGNLGWNVVNETLQIMQYTNGLDTTMTYFINSNLPEFRVFVKATYQTEEGFDYLSKESPTFKVL